MAPKSEYPTKKQRLAADESYVHRYVPPLLRKEEAFCEEKVMADIPEFGEENSPPNATICALHEKVILTSKDLEHCIRKKT